MPYKWVQVILLCGLSLKNAYKYFVYSDLLKRSSSLSSKIFSTYDDQTKNINITK